jgi:tetratricopeptide (TPR) repeat protein
VSLFFHKATPLQRQYTGLMQQLKASQDPEERPLLRAGAARAARVMLERNLQAVALEKQGRLDEAVALYEANVADEFPGDFPYRRLWTIYYQRGSYEAAGRACRMALKYVAGQPGALGRRQLEAWANRCIDLARQQSGSRPRSPLARLTRLVRGTGSAHRVQPSTPPACEKLVNIR